MSKLNDHIEEYLNYYLNLKGAPGFAVLLSGEWGCGKTWFIKHFISSYETRGLEPLRFLYITLYGVTATAEIEDQLFQQLHPILASKPMVLASKILKGFLKTSLKIDLSDKSIGTSATVTPDLKDIDIPDYLKNTDDCVFIFDDLERCQMPLPIRLGYINSFVEHQGSKVIIIANESELDHPKANDARNAEDYRRIKEKLVGKTFTVLYDLDSALDSFLNQIESPDVRVFLKDQMRQIADAFGRAGFYNLRHLHRAFLEFERLHKSLSETHRQLPGLLTDLLPVFLAFSFEVQAGKLRPSDIQGFMIKMAKAFTSKKDDPTQASPVEMVAGKYGLMDKYNLILSEECWSKFFEKGFIPSAELSESIENSSYAENQKMPAWLKLWYTWDLDEKEFSDLLDTIIKQCERGEFHKPGEILQVAGMLLSFSSLGLISKNLEDTLNDCRTYVDKIATSGVWTQEDIRSVLFPQFGREDSYLNHGFYGTELKQFTEFRAYLEGQLQKTQDKLMPSKAKDLLQLLAKDPGAFARNVNIIGNNPDDPIYHDTPVFQHIAAQEFIDQLLQISNKDKRIIGKALGQRYQIEQSSRHLTGEKEFLKDLKQRIEIEVQVNKGPLTAHILKTQVLNNIGVALTTLETMEGKIGSASRDEARSLIARV